MTLWISLLLALLQTLLSWLVVAQANGTKLSALDKEHLREAVDLMEKAQSEAEKMLAQ